MGGNESNVRKNIPNKNSIKILLMSKMGNIKIKNKSADAKPSEEWFISMFLRSLEFEKQLKWWNYPGMNGGLNIPFCWLFLSIGCLANFYVLFSPEFFDLLHNSLIAKYLATILFGLMNCSAAAGLWMEFPFLLFPILAFYFTLSSITFIYFIFSLPALIYLKQPFPQYYLLAPLLPLNILTSKSLCGVFLLLKSGNGKSEKIKMGRNGFVVEKKKKGIGENKFLKNIRNFIEKNNKKYWIDQLQRKMGEKEENCEDEYCSRILMDAGKSWGNRRQNEEEENSNISEFYGQIVERKIVEKNLKEEKSAEIVQMPNGEVRRRRFKKKKKLAEKRRSQERDSIPLMIMENESSATEPQKIKEYEQHNYQRMLSNGMGQQFVMGEEGQKKCKKPPIPRPRTSRPNANFGDDAHQQICGTSKVPWNGSQSGGSTLASPTILLPNSPNNLSEFCRETEV